MFNTVATVAIDIPHGDTLDLYDQALTDAGFHVRRTASVKATVDAGGTDIVITYVRHLAHFEPGITGSTPPTIVLASYEGDGQRPDCAAVIVLPLLPQALVATVRQVLQGGAGVPAGGDLG